MAVEALAAALADSLGEQALAWFLAALAVALATVVVAWRLAAPFLRRPDAAVHASLAQLALRVATGFLVIVGASFAFAELAEEVGEGEVIASFDERLTLAIARNVDSTSLQWFAALTRLGDTPTLAVLCVLVAAWLLMRGRRGLALGWVAAVAGNGILSQTLKEVFERVRPLHDDGLVQAHGWSFPSGHSSGSVVAYGMLAYVLARTVPPPWHLPIVLLATAIAFTVGSSRVFLRVHFASDVIAGFLSGIAWLSVCVVSVELARRYPRR